MEEIKDALFRAVGLFMIVLAAIVGAATCGDYYGQNHPVDSR